MNVVHISGENYDQMRISLTNQAASLKSRVNSKDIQLDLDFEGAMKRLYAKEIEAAQAKTSSTTASPTANNIAAAPSPEN